MKKIFTCFIALTLAMSMSAQTTYEIIPVEMSNLVVTTMDGFEMLEASYPDMGLSVTLGVYPDGTLHEGSNVTHGQRSLPIVEGSTVVTKYGPIKTDFILFIAAGAFHVAAIEDLIPELQGRFPVSVELHSLTKEDFVKILTETENSLVFQYSKLLGVDNIDLQFDEGAIERIAEVSVELNLTSEDIGARRLHTVMEYLLEDISFNAGGDYPTFTLRIDRKYVDEHLQKLTGDRNLKKYVL